MAVSLDRSDKLFIAGHVVAIVGMLGLFAFGILRASLWPFVVIAIGFPLLRWHSRRRMWTILRKRDVRCVACGAALWAPHGPFSKFSMHCPSCGEYAFERPSTPRPLPWFARDVTGSMRFWTLIFGGGGLGFGLWVRFVQGLPMGSLEWTFLVLGGVMIGLVIGAVWWHVFARTLVEQRTRR